MQIDISPETDRLLREELRRGSFRSVDEMIRAGIESRHEPGASSVSASLPDNLVDLFAPVREILDGEELDLSRSPSTRRPVDLG